MEQRLDFVREYETELFTMTELAAHYGVSRKTAYKWVERTKPTVPSGCAIARAGRSTVRRPRIPSWWRRCWRTADGTRAGGEEAARDCGAAPAPRRVAESIDRVYVAQTARLGRAAPAPRAVAARPRRAAGTDYRGEPGVDDRIQRGISDGRWRLLLSVDPPRWLQPLRPAVRRVSGPHDHRDAPTVRTRFAYGLPERIRSDNGVPFASPGLGGLSQLSVWWIRLGIVPERIAPGHPEQNGSHEQFHSRAESRNGAAAGAQLRRATAALSPVLSRIQRRTPA